jgi:hypothetical protein
LAPLAGADNGKPLSGIDWNGLALTSIQIDKTKGFYKAVRSTSEQAMTLSDDERRAMIAATHDMALAMVDDLEHIRELLAKSEPTAGDIRRMSNVLRRILIDNSGDLRKVATPRIGYTSADPIRREATL